MNKPSTKILLIEDDEDDYFIMDELLSDIPSRRYSLEWVSSVTEALSAIVKDDHDICLLDHHLGSLTGLEIIEEARNAGAQMPIILLTGQGNIELDEQAMAAGADDYVNKSDLSAPLLEHIIRYAIERKKQERELSLMAFIDPLTGTSNRNLFAQLFNQALSRTDRHHNALGLLYLDLDKFKEINDTLGHNIGDQVLKYFSSVLMQCVRKGDTVSRMGGDEFTIMLEGLNSTDDAVVIAKKVLLRLSEPYLIEDNTLELSSSIGIAIFPQHALSGDELIAHADAAMYLAKQKGGNTFRIYKGTAEKPSRLVSL